MNTDPLKLTCYELALKTKGLNGTIAAEQGSVFGSTVYYADTRPALEIAKEIYGWVIGADHVTTEVNTLARCKDNDPILFTSPTIAQEVDAVQRDKYWDNEMLGFEPKKVNNSKIKPKR